MISNIKILIVICLLILLQNSCERIEYFPDNPIDFSGTVILAHHGAGDLDEPNTIQSAICGLNNLQGIECDIQMGLEGSLWLDHSSIIPGCGSIKKTVYAELSDTQIGQLNECLGDEFNAYKLDSVFRYISENGKGKLISLDVKAWEPVNFKNVNIISQMNRLAQSIINLTNKYNLNGQVMVESETGDFLYYIKTHGKGIETYLSTNGDFELGISRALHSKFTGVSFKYMFDEDITAEGINMIHRKGLKIHLWTVNDSAQIKDAILLRPDYIQTDNIDFAKKCY